MNIRALCQRAETSDQQHVASLVETQQRTCDVCSKMRTKVQKRNREIQAASNCIRLLNDSINAHQQSVEKKLRNEKENLRNCSATLEGEMRKLAATEEELRSWQEKCQASTDRLVQERHRLQLFLGLTPGLSESGYEFSFKFIDPLDPQREFKFTIRQSYGVTSCEPHVDEIDEINASLKERRISLVEAICQIRSAFRTSKPTLPL